MYPDEEKYLARLIDTIWAILDEYVWVLPAHMPSFTENVVEFIDLFAVAQSLPGIFAVNISIFVGYKLKKLPGAICCALGTILPSFLIILGIALFFTQFKDNSWVEKIFKGLRPAVVALIAVPCLTTARSIKLSHKQLIIPIGAALLIWLAGLSPVWIILAAIFGGIIYQKIIVKK